MNAPVQAPGCAAHQPKVPAWAEAHSRGGRANAAAAQLLQLCLAGGPSSGHACEQVCVVCIWICVHACVCLCARVCVCVHAYTPACVRIYMCANASMHTRTCMCLHGRNYMRRQVRRGSSKHVYNARLVVSAPWSAVQHMHTSDGALRNSEDACKRGVVWDTGVPAICTQPRSQVLLSALVLPGHPSGHEFCTPKHTSGVHQSDPCRHHSLFPFKQHGRGIPEHSVPQELMRRSATKPP